ncbi:MAG TPA: autotransporter assembly complex family protein [Steroidobacteraceae bacterium]|nr:autotransporter assembly complex family protein [Steroidobacteraceae bacterium]
MRPERMRRWCVLLLLAATVPAAAHIRVTIEGVEGEERNNVTTRLSVERYKDRAGVDGDTMHRLVNRIDGEVRNALRPFGYYQPTVAYDYQQSGKDWRVAIAIKPGEPVRVRDLTVEIHGPGKDDAAFDSVRQQNLLRVGMRLHHGEYDKVKGDMLRIAQSHGYLDAKMARSEMLVDTAALSASITLVMDTGPRYSFGRIDIQQTTIRPGLMSRFLRFREGEPYSAEELLRTQFALDDSLYFSQVDVTPEDADHDALTVPVSITATPSRPSFSLGGGYGTDTGVRGTLGWTDSRVNDRGHSFRAEIQASRVKREVDSRYDIPIGDPALERMSLEAQNTYDELSDIQTNTTALTPSVTRVHGLWQTVTSVALTHTTTDEGIDKLTSNLLVPGIAFASVPRGFLGQELFSRTFYVELLGSHTALGSDSNFLRLHVQTEHGFDLDPKWHLLLRGEVGAALVSNFDDLPGIYRFFAGGDRSVRGFAYDSLSPEGTVTNSSGASELKKIGGRYLLTGSTELVRDLPWWNLAVATFFDFGNAFNNLHDPLQYAAGVGLRYRLPGVSIGLDIAKPLSTTGALRLDLNITPKL